MDRSLKIAVILSAYDRMTEVVTRAVSRSNQQISALQSKSAAAFSKGFGMTAAATAGLMSLAPAISAYAELEDASVSLQTQMMDANGKVSSYFEKINAQAVQLGNRLPGTTADFQELYKAILENGISAQSILGGTGKAAAYLAVGLKMGYTEAGIAAARLKSAAGVSDDQMETFIDTIARTKATGVKDMSEMIYAFNRSAGALKTMGLQGLQASKDVSALFALLVKTNSGETAGTSFSSILNSFYDPKKMAKFQAAAKSYGLSIDFVDQKTGNFKGVENMMVQLDKMKNLTVPQKTSLANALLGGGQDASVFTTLIDTGVTGFKAIQAQMNNQASLTQKVEAQLGTLKNTWEATTGTFENAKASIGSSVGPELKSISEYLGSISEKIQAFTQAHPALTKAIVLSVAAVSAFLGIVGAIFLIKGAWLGLSAVMMANPWVAVAAAAVVAIMFIYANWGAIRGWFVKLWNNIRAIFLRFWNWAKGMFLNYTPYGLIIKHWSKITAFFSALWEKVKNIFLGHVQYVMDLGGRFFEAGKNIVLSIWNGIKALANKPIEAIKAITQKMRDYLPFSPAKEGAFRDLHRVKIIETIVSSMRPEKLMNAMSQVTNMAFGAMQRPAYALAGSGASAGGPTNITLNITVNGVSNVTDFIAQLQRNPREVAKAAMAGIKQMDRAKF